MNSDANLAQAAQQMQETFAHGLKQVMGAMAGGGPGMPAGFAQLGMSGPPAALPPLQIDPLKLLEIQKQYVADISTLWNSGLQSGTQAATDRRFAAEAWQQNPVAQFAASAYLLNARTLMGLADAIEGDEKTKARVRFAVEQAMAAAAPSNFLALNAEAQKKAIETQGQSIAQGLTNLLSDMKQGHVSMTDESLFEVGKNVATTEGAVVFENEF
ncbi:MAG: class I poly(R)-hydroxyalkanoic acid synthase, partial [Polaromonas sp.]|nr:class I poly(R)-hydroxyalkanoic acid synthase [Polaromonas sp.]